MHTYLYPKYQFDCILNDKFNSSLYKLIDNISEKLNLNKNDLFEMFRRYYISKFNGENIKLRTMLKQHINYKLSNPFNILKIEVVKMKISKIFLINKFIHFL